MKLRKYFSFRWTSVAALTGVLAGVLSTAPGHAQTVTVVMQSGLRILDPGRTTATMTHNHGYMIYDTLLAVDAQRNIRPQMADWQVSDDGKTYTFTLRDGLRWHDGSAVTAADCVASIQRWGQVDLTGKLLMPKLARIQTLDPQRFEIHLTEPTPLLLEGLSQLAARPLFIMPKRVAETPVTTQITETVGSGPFRFVASEFQPGLKVVYEKNPDYVPRAEPASWTAGGKVVHVDRVEWVAMPDQMTAVNALVNGEIDYIQEVPFDFLPFLQRHDHLRVHVLDQLGSQTYFRLNHLQAPFNNKLLRQAALAAVAQEDVLKALVGNPAYYQPCAAVMGCGNQYADDYGADWVIPARVELAQSLLKQAGYDGTPVVILHPTDLAMLSVQPVVVGAALRRAGFNVEMKSLDWQTLVNQRENRKSVFEGGWSIFSTKSILVVSGNPINNITLAAAGEQSWLGWPDVPEMERLRARFVSSNDSAERHRLAAQMQTLSSRRWGSFTSPRRTARA